MNHNNDVKSRLRVAITGGIAEGKSTVLGMIAEEGFSTASSDEIAAEVFDLHSVQQELARLLESEAPVSRDLLRKAMREDPSLRRRLNTITHWRIAERIASSPSQFIEVPLLYETVIQHLFSHVWVVSCGVDEQLRRLRERHRGDEGSDRMIGTQLPTPVKVAFADILIRTNEDVGSVHKQVFSALRRDFG